MCTIILDISVIPSRVNSQVNMTLKIIIVKVDFINDANMQFISTWLRSSDKILIKKRFSAIVMNGQNM